jgi:hypothetical protein
MPKVSEVVQRRQFYRKPDNSVDTASRLRAGWRRSWFSIPGMGKEFSAKGLDRLATLTSPPPPSMVIGWLFSCGKSADYTPAPSRPLIRVLGAILSLLHTSSWRGITNISQIYECHRVKASVFSSAAPRVYKLITAVSPVLLTPLVSLPIRHLSSQR